MIRKFHALAAASGLLVSLCASAHALAQETEAPTEAYVQLMGAPSKTLRWAGGGDSRTSRPMCLYSPSERAELVLSVTRLTPMQDAAPFVFAVTDAAGVAHRSEPMIQGEVRWIVSADNEECTSPNARLEIILPARAALASVAGLHDVSLSLSVEAR